LPNSPVQIIAQAPHNNSKTHYKNKRNHKTKSNNTKAKASVIHKAIGGKRKAQEADVHRY
jgi:hypothetical protein